MTHMKMLMVKRQTGLISLTLSGQLICRLTLTLLYYRQHTQTVLLRLQFSFLLEPDWNMESRISDSLMWVII